MSILKMLSLQKMEKLCKEFESLEKDFNTFKIKAQKQKKELPLDYIMALPKHVSTELIQKTGEIKKNLESNKLRVRDKIKEENDRRRF
jgi:adenylyl- and sulfurtransferase ThiI